MRQVHHSDVSESTGDGHPGWLGSLLNGSEMGRRIREFDWARTPLGPIESWPQSLRAHVGMVVDNQFPMYIFWGPQNIAIYNDGYIRIAGDKHPRVLGMPTEAIWSEVWPVLAPLVQQAKGGDPVMIDDLELTLLRYGLPEESHHALSYSPLRDDSGEIAGVLATLTDTTTRILAHRRLVTLRELGSRTGVSLTQSDCLAKISEALAGNADIPFALIYLAGEGSLSARLAVSVGVADASIALQRIELSSNGDEMQQDAAESFAGLGRALVVPISAPDQQRRIGALVTGISPLVRTDDTYREFVSRVAAQIGNSVTAARVFAEERDRAESQQLVRTVEKLQLFAESGQQLFWTTKPDGWIDWYNQGWYDYTGQTFEEAQGWGWKAVHHPRDLEEVLRRWPECLELRIPFEMTFRLLGADGRYRWFLTRAVPELTGEGQVIRWYGTNTNIDSERRAAQQLDFFSNLGDRLVQRPDRTGALRALAESLTPEFADWTLINLADADGTLILSAAHHHQPEKSRLLEPFVGFSYDPKQTSAATQVFKSGKPVLLEDVDVGIVRGCVCDDFAAVVEALGMRSVIVVPIVANGKVTGTFHALSGEGDIMYGRRDVPFFEETGRRMGFALQNAEAYERESRIAHAFQSAALPVVLPDVPGMYFSSLYEPASHEANVGGDFYDAFRLVDGRVVVSIGDVAGSGLGAAATMAALRQSIRAVASVNPDPEMLLKAADGVFSDTGRAPFASAFVAVIDPLTFSIQYANAGHPSPVLRSPDGSVSMLGGSDLLLGVHVGSHYGGRHVGKVLAQAGSLLALYTDGLTEATRDPIDGELRLLGAVSDLNADEQTAPHAARAISDAVLGVGRASHDDVAVITVFLQTPLLELVSDSVPRWQFAAGDGTAAHRVRNEIVRILQASGVGKEDVFAAEMVFSELIGNVVRHAGTALDVALDLTQEAPVLHVLDSGDGFSLNPKLPADAYAERGRGLYIITQLAREFTVSPRTICRGSHARAVLCGMAK